MISISQANINQMGASTTGDGNPDAAGLVRLS